MNIKKINTKLIATGLSFIMMGSMVGCQKQETKKETETPKTTQSTIDTMYKNVNNEIKVNTADESFTITQEEEKAFATLINMDYISAEIVNNETALSKLYPNGMTLDKFISNYERFIDAYREYTLNLKDSNKFILLGEYLIDETTKDYFAFKYIENMIKSDINLKNQKETTIDELKEAFNAHYEILYKFYNGEKEIKLTTGDLVKVTDLSYGAQMVIEEYGKIFSVLSKDYLDTEKRENLDNVLDAHNSKSHVENNFIKSTKKDANEDTNIGIIGEADQEKVEAFNKTVDSVTVQLDEQIKATQAEIKSVVIVSNIEYFDPTTLEILVKDTASDFDEVMLNSKSLLKKVAINNIVNFAPYILETKTIKNKELTQSEIDTIGTIGTEKAIQSIGKTRIEKETFDENKTVDYLVRFLALDPKAVYTYKDGEKTVNVDYNTLSEGAKFVTYSLIKDEFNNVCMDSVRFENIKEIVEENYNPEKILESFYQETCNKTLTK